MLTTGIMNINNSDMNWDEWQREMVGTTGIL